MDKKLTLRAAQNIAKSLGLKITSIPDCGEYVVNFRKRETIGGHVFGGEATAYYTTDLDDAVGTARAMHQEMKESWKDER